MALRLLFGCNNPVSRAATETSSSAVPQLVRQPDGQEWMVIDLSQIAGLSIGKAQEIPLPGILEAVGQVTFDDRLVSTMISRVSGRLEDIRVSQWDAVRTGENVLSIYSPDFMTAEAEYLEATSSASQSGGAGTSADAFGMPAGNFGMTANLKAAAVKNSNCLVSRSPIFRPSRKPRRRAGCGR